MIYIPDFKVDLDSSSDLPPIDNKMSFELKDLQKGVKLQRYIRDRHVEELRLWCEDENKNC